VRGVSSREDIPSVAHSDEVLLEVSDDDSHVVDSWLGRQGEV